MTRRCARFKAGATLSAELLRGRIARTTLSTENRETRPAFTAEFHLVEGLGSPRLLLLVNYRPEYEHRWASKTTYSQLRLDALPAESAAELLAALLGPDPGLVPLAQMLVKRGNPFFLEETVRTLVETGALVGKRARTS